MPSHAHIIFVKIVSVQDEEQDPLLNSFAHLKETLNGIKGKWSHGDIGWIFGDQVNNIKLPSSIIHSSCRRLTYDAIY